MPPNLHSETRVAVAVAPPSVGTGSLEGLLKQACQNADLEPLGPARMLSEAPPWVCVEYDVRLQTSRDEARRTLERLMPEGIDIALVGQAHRRKKLLISDMDSTMIEQECLDELAGYAGLKEEIAAITARAMAGELDFESALTERVARLKGLSLEALARCYEERITLMPGARTLVTTMAGHGAHCLLVSGGFTYFTSRVAATIGFHADQGNQLMDDGTVLTGSVGLPILGRQAKLDALQAAAETHGLTLEDSLAMGDGANDLAMISAAGLGLAVHAKPVVAAASDAAILHTDLTAALFFQGYTGRDIVWR
jgi:phosphoserine phosphatase